MSVKIRLRRMGRKKQPHYRVVVADTASPRDGRFVESLGYYRPLTEPARLVLDLERVDYWIGQGALPSHTVKNLITRARKGGDEKVAVGEPDTDAEKARQAEELAARRQAEEEALKAAEAEKKAAEAEKKAAAEAEAKKKAEEAAADDADEGGDDEETTGEG
ncbi:MAG: 30S ribosomal protein S16 [Gemmatimonadales bacterium]|nr:MAG: 30S ribosomal protein S16 [Gemmatimonadales bacterium]